MIARSLSGRTILQEVFLSGSVIKAAGATALAAALETNDTVLTLHLGCASYCAAAASCCDTVGPGYGACAGE